FYLSCNPVFVQLGDRVGQDSYYNWIRKLGFYGRTGIDLPAEAQGLLHTNPMPIDFANLTFGESSSLTAIQMAQFFAMIGNGGFRVTPRLGSATAQEGIDVLAPFLIAESPRMFSKETCERVRSMLGDVVTKGTASGTFGAIGLNIGGKTGTAIDTFDNDRRTFSFVGLLPNDNPEYVVLISIHKPETAITLSTVAARAATRVGARILNMQGLKQNYSREELSYLNHSVELPDFTGMKIAEIALQLTILDLAPSVPLDRFYLDQTCVRMYPTPGSKIGRGSTVWLYPDRENEVEWVTVPDFKGRNYHECVWQAAEYGVTIEPVGIPWGIALAQDIAPTSSRVLTTPDNEAGSPSFASEDERDISGKVRRGQVVKVYFTSTPQSEADIEQGGDH
ncbi:MAG TPA: penicillin-binding transpeptidase domain-containing protein, partial [Clostridia bacterium]|nr:penicillin-binding transpeptidase domain-containing protein [Clostridia bacterium]